MLVLCLLWLGLCVAACVVSRQGPASAHTAPKPTTASNPKNTQQQVMYKYGVDTHNMLKEAGADVTFKTYNGMAHGVSSNKSRMSSSSGG